jgi:uncharacterized membrane protein/protein-disulfide isomerase
MRARDVNQAGYNPVLMRLKLAIACALIACGLGLMLRYETAIHEITGADSSCTVNEKINCDAVQSSKYAKLFGVSVSLLAVAGSALFAILLLLRPRFGETMLVIAGLFGGLNALTSLVYLGISLFVLGVNCLYCNGIQILSIVSFVLIAPLAWRARSAGVSRLSIGSTAFVSGVLLLFLFLGDSYAREQTRLGKVRDFTQGGERMRVEVSDAIVLGDPVRGAENSYVVYFDFGCPNCLKCYRMASAIVKRAPDRAHFFFKHWPLDRECNKTLNQTSHPNSCRAAAAGTAAAAHGKSAEALATLFDMNNLFTTGRLTAISTKLGIDPETWKASFDSDAAKKVVLRDVGEGNRLDLSGVPAVFLNGRRMQDMRLPRR